MRKFTIYPKQSIQASSNNLDIIEQIRRSFRSFGKFTINDAGVRFISLEDDLAQFMSRSAFDAYLNKCADSGITDIDDIVDDIPWEHTIGVHHSFEEADYTYEKRRLNQLYKFAKPAPNRQSDKSTTSGTPKLTYTSLKKLGAPIVPWIDECKQILSTFSVYTQSVSVYDENYCRVRITLMGHVSLDRAKQKLSQFIAQFPGQVDVKYGSVSDWRLTCVEVYLKLDAVE